MLKYIVKRLLNLIPVIFIISIVIFGTVKKECQEIQLMLIWEWEKQGYPEQKQQIREELGLDKSLPEQYVIWVEILLKENWGHLPSSNFQFLKSLETTYGIHSC